MSSKDSEHTPPRSATLSKMQQAAVVDSPSRLTRYQLRRIGEGQAGVDTAEASPGPERRRSTRIARGRHSIAGCQSEDSDAGSVMSEPPLGIATRRSTRASSQQPRSPPKEKMTRTRRNSLSSLTTCSGRSTRNNPRLSPIMSEEPASEATPPASPRKLLVDLSPAKDKSPKAAKSVASPSPAKASPQESVSLEQEIIPLDRKGTTPQYGRSPRLSLKDINKKLSLVAIRSEDSRPAEIALTATSKAATPKSAMEPGVQTPEAVPSMQVSPKTPSADEQGLCKTPKSGPQVEPTSAEKESTRMKTRFSERLEMVESIQGDSNKSPMSSPVSIAKSSPAVVEDERPVRSRLSRNSEPASNPKPGGKVSISADATPEATSGKSGQETRGIRSQSASPLASKISTAPSSPDVKTKLWCGTRPRLNVSPRGMSPGTPNSQGSAVSENSELCDRKEDSSEIVLDDSKVTIDLEKNETSQKHSSDGGGNFVRDLDESDKESDGASVKKNDDVVSLDGSEELNVEDDADSDKKADEDDDCKIVDYVNNAKLLDDSDEESKNEGEVEDVNNDTPSEAEEGSEEKENSFVAKSGAKPTERKSSSRSQPNTPVPKPSPTLDRGTRTVRKSISDDPEERKLREANTPGSTSQDVPESPLSPTAKTVLSPDRNISLNRQPKTPNTDSPQSSNQDLSDVEESPVLQTGKTSLDTQPKTPMTQSPDGSPEEVPRATTVRTPLPPRNILHEPESSSPDVDSPYSPTQGLPAERTSLDSQPKTPNTKSPCSSNQALSAGTTSSESQRKTPNTKSPCTPNQGLSSKRTSLDSEPKTPNTKSPSSSNQALSAGTTSSDSQRKTPNTKSPCTPNQGLSSKRTSVDSEPKTPNTKSPSSSNQALSAGTTSNDSQRKTPNTKSPCSPNQGLSSKRTSLDSQPKTPNSPSVRRSSRQTPAVSPVPVTPGGSSPESEPTTPNSTSSDNADQVVSVMKKSPVTLPDENPSVESQPQTNTPSSQSSDQEFSSPSPVNQSKTSNFTSPHSASKDVPAEGKSPSTTSEQASSQESEVNTSVSKSSSDADAVSSPSVKCTPAEAGDRQTSKKPSSKNGSGNQYPKSKKRKLRNRQGHDSDYDFDVLDDVPKVKKPRPNSFEGVSESQRAIQVKPRRLPKFTIRSVDRPSDKVQLPQGQKTDLRATFPNSFTIKSNAKPVKPPVYTAKREEKLKNPTSVLFEHEEWDQGEGASVEVPVKDFTKKKKKKKPLPEHEDNGGKVPKKTDSPLQDLSSRIKTDERKKKKKDKTLLPVQDESSAKSSKPTLVAEFSSLPESSQQKKGKHVFLNQVETTVEVAEKTNRCLEEPPSEIETDRQKKKKKKKDKILLPVQDEISAKSSKPTLVAEFSSLPESSQQKKGKHVFSNQVETSAKTKSQKKTVLDPCSLLKTAEAVNKELEVLLEREKRNEVKNKAFEEPPCPEAVVNPKKKKSKVEHALLEGTYVSKPEEPAEVGEKKKSKKKINTVEEVVNPDDGGSLFTGQFSVTDEVDKRLKKKKLKPNHQDNNKDEVDGDEALIVEYNGKKKKHKMTSVEQDVGSEAQNEESRPSEDLNGVKKKKRHLEEAAIDDVSVKVKKAKNSDSKSDGYSLKKDEGDVESKREKKRRKLEERLQRQMFKSSQPSAAFDSQNDDDAPTAISFSKSRDEALEEESRKEMFLKEKERRKQEERKLKHERLLQQKSEKKKRRREVLEEGEEFSEALTVPLGKKTYFGDGGDAESVLLGEASTSQEEQKLSDEHVREQKKRERELAKILQRRKLMRSAFVPAEAATGTTRFGVVPLKNLNSAENKMAEAAVSFRDRMLLGKRIRRTPLTVRSSQKEKREAMNAHNARRFVQ